MQDPARQLVAKALRTLAWSAITILAFITLVPIELRPSTGHADGERFFTYVVLAVLWSLAYSQHRFAVVIGLLIAAGLLEGAQTLTQTRHGRWDDLWVKSFGIILGTCLTPQSTFAYWAQRRACFSAAIWTRYSVITAWCFHTTSSRGTPNDVSKIVNVHDKFDLSADGKCRWTNTKSTLTVL